jgi:copper chaperone NosL
MKRLRGFAYLVSSSLLAGCGTADQSRPPNVRFGEEACAFCRMIISDDRFAAAVVIKTGEALKFDDIGCMILHEARQVRPGAAYWVRNFTGRDWLNAREATFVHSTKFRSPMDHGLAAMPMAQAADELSKSIDGRTLQFSELPSLLGDQPSESASDLSRPL